MVREDTLSLFPFYGHFPGGTGLADTRISPFWILLELRMMEMVVITEALRSAQLQSNHHHHQTNTQLFTGWMPFLLPDQQCQSTKGKHVKILMMIYWHTCVAGMHREPHQVVLCDESVDTFHHRSGAAAADCTGLGSWCSDVTQADRPADACRWVDQALAKDWISVWLMSFFLFAVTCVRCSPSVVDRAINAICVSAW